MRVIVIGLGIIGSAAAQHLAQRGHEVLAFDANERGHNKGASHGTTRIIRQAYYEAPDYVPLLRRAYELWDELARQTGEKLFTQTGGLFIGEPDSELVVGSHHSARQHGIAHEYLTAAQLNQRFPMFYLPNDLVGVFEPTAGILHAERCLNAQLDMATEHGAKLQFSDAVKTWVATGGGVKVTAESGDYTADALVITSGPWAPQVLKQYTLPLLVRRVVLCYFEPDDAARFAETSCPIYCVSERGEFYYGFPYESGKGIKIGRHDDGPACTPESCDRNVYPEEIGHLKERLNYYLPGSVEKYNSSLTCLYTMTPDTHFIIDQDADHANIVYACGFSGHGFKFGSVMGDVLADIATTGGTAHPVGFLSASRFAQSGGAPAPEIVSALDRLNKATSAEKTDTQNPSRPVAQ